jgi:hypothetical protein
MQTLIAGATAVETATIPKDDGSLEDSSAFTWSAEWKAGAGAAPPTPVITTVDTTHRLVVASSGGLGGQAVALRVTAEDPISGRVWISESQYLVKA